MATYHSVMHDDLQKEAEGGSSSPFFLLQARQLVGIGDGTMHSGVCHDENLGCLRKCHQKQ